MRSIGSVSAGAPHRAQQPPPPPQSAKAPDQDSSKIAGSATQPTSAGAGQINLQT